MSDDERIAEFLERWEELQEAGRPAAPEELCRDCPELTERLRRRIEELRWVDRLLEIEPPAGP